MILVGVICGLTWIFMVKVPSRQECLSLLVACLRLRRLVGWNHGFFLSLSSYYISGHTQASFARWEMYGSMGWGSTGCDRRFRHDHDAITELHLFNLVRAKFAPAIIFGPGGYLVFMGGEGRGGVSLFSICIAGCYISTFYNASPPFTVKRTMGHGNG